MHYSDLIQTIKKRRGSLQLTQEHLAEISKLGLRTLKQFESGKGNPTLKTIKKLADVLGMELCLQIKKMDNK